MTQVTTFWRDVEIFNIPGVPKSGWTGRASEAGLAQAGDDGDVETDTSGRPKRTLQTFDTTDARRLPALPWYERSFHPVRGDPAKPADSYAHVVYLGVAPKQQFVECILRTHGIPRTDDELYRPANGRGWLVGFIVDQYGVPLARTYVPASFAVGSELLREGRSLDDVGWELQARGAAFDARMDERRQQAARDDPAAAPFGLTWEDLFDERDLALQWLGGASAALAPLIMIESVRLYRQENGTLKPAPEAAGSLMNSFFFDDLTALLQQGPPAYSVALAQYLGPDSMPAERIDLLADGATLAAHVTPALIPAGRWVAAPKHHLALAQQAAVYQVIHRIGQHEGERSRGLMAINGPPGTGKTTLLRDLIAHVIVERARRISALRDPQALFTTQIIRIDGGSEHYTRGRALRAGIVDGTEIVVASNNNAAVENISLDCHSPAIWKHFPMPRTCPRWRHCWPKNSRSRATIIHGVCCLAHWVRSHGAPRLPKR